MPTVTRGHSQTAGFKARRTKPRASPRDGTRHLTGPRKDSTRTRSRCLEQGPVPGPRWAWLEPGSRDCPRGSHQGRHQAFINRRRLSEDTLHALPVFPLLAWHRLTEMTSSTSNSPLARPRFRPLAQPPPLQGTPPARAGTRKFRGRQPMKPPLPGRGSAHRAEPRPHGGAPFQSSARRHTTPPTERNKRSRFPPPHIVPPTGPTPRRGPPPNHSDAPPIELSSARHGKSRPQHPGWSGIAVV